MLSNRPFHAFESKDEALDYMRQYKLIAPTKKIIPTLYYRTKNFSTTCQLLGYEQNYDTFSIAVIDYGEGPYFIHVDYLKDMQASPERNKGKRLNNLPETYVIFDTETTGKNVLEAELINIAAIRVSNGEIIATYDSLVKPNNPIPSQITKLTGITDLDVCCAPDAQTVLSEFLDFIGSDILVGYNIASYDTTLIYDLVKSFWGNDFQNDYFDLYYYFKEKIPQSEVANYKLTTISSYLGIDNSQAHRAIEDCKICLYCYQALTLPDEESIEYSQANVNSINNAFEQSIVVMLNDIIAEKELPQNSLYLYSNRSTKGVKKGLELSKSISIHEPEYPVNPNAVNSIGKNQVVLKIEQKDEYNIILTIRKPQFEAINYQAHLKAKLVKDFYNVSFTISDPLLLPFIKINVEHCLKVYRSSNTFSCCSQFVKCSDALKCVHENKLYSTGCAYRRNLENGRIFYGKNRNID